MEKFSKNSAVFPIVLKVGDKIIHLNPKDLENSIKNGKILKTFKGD
jgi:hypothetical protein